MEELRNWMGGRGGNKATATPKLEKQWEWEFNQSPVAWVGCLQNLDSLPRVQWVLEQQSQAAAGHAAPGRGRS